MNLIELIITALSGIRLVLANPAVGGGSSLRLEEASELLGIFSTLLTQGDAAHADLVAFTGVVSTMAASGRAPTRAEWADLRNRSDAAHAELQRIKAELDQGGSPTPPDQTYPVSEPASESVSDSSVGDSSREVPNS